jgi:hypothetical protein
MRKIDSEIIIRLRIKDIESESFWFSFLIIPRDINTRQRTIKKVINEVKKISKGDLVRFQNDIKLAEEGARMDKELIFSS